MLKAASQKLLEKTFRKFQTSQSCWCCKPRLSCWGSSAAVTPAPLCERPLGTTAQIDEHVQPFMTGETGCCWWFTPLSWKIDETYSRNLRVMNKWPRTVHHLHDRSGHARSPAWHNRRPVWASFNSALMWWNTKPPDSWLNTVHSHVTVNFNLSPFATVVSDWRTVWMSFSLSHEFIIIHQYFSLGLPASHLRRELQQHTTFLQLCQPARSRGRWLLRDGKGFGSAASERFSWPHEFSMMRHRVIRDSPGETQSDFCNSSKTQCYYKVIHHACFPSGRMKHVISTAAWRWMTTFAGIFSSRHVKYQ